MTQPQTGATAAGDAGDKLAITKERVKAWDACASGYRWFLEKFPQGGQFSEVYAALQADRRYDDSGWLLERVFCELDAGEQVRQTVVVSGADRSKIEALAAQGSDANAATTGEGANAATTGKWANAATTGEGANAATTGNRSNAATTGEGANAATTGKWANAATTGEGANAATTGKWANAATTGKWANAATTGKWANAATTGEGANAATTGEGANAATTGEGAVAAALGYGAKAKASAGGAICIVWRAAYPGKEFKVFASKVGENNIKPDTWYALGEDGKPMEVNDV